MLSLYVSFPDDGIVISLGDRVIPNHGLVTAQDIGIDPTGTNLTAGLKCNTTYGMCCADFTDGKSMVYQIQYGERPSGRGGWLYAHAVETYISRQVDVSSHTFGITRNGNAVYVFRNKVSAPVIIDGIWRCVIPDSSGTEQTKYIGVYFNSSNG